MLDEAMRRIHEAKRTRLTELDLSDLDLSELPEEVCELTGLTKLDLRSNRLAALPEPIGELTSLTELDLHDNQLTALPESVGRLGALTELDLSLNRLAAVPDAIGTLTALTTLDLSRNDLRTLPASICALVALVDLDLHENDLESLPDAIGRLTALTDLDVSYNDLQALPESIGNLQRLRDLVLSDNRLNSLPQSLGALTELTNLDLDDNRLVELPESIGGLHKLTSLRCGSNDLRHLPATLTHLTGLSTLELNDNALSALPEQIGVLTELDRLHLSGNRLAVLPASIGELRGLTQLTLHFNRLTALPDTIENLTNLQELDLSHNRLDSLPDGIGKLTAITKLRARNNDLLALPESIGNLTALTEADFWDCSIAVLPDSIGNLTALTSLDLAFNRLSALPESIGNLTALTELDLSYNRLSALPESIGNLTALTELEASANQLAVLPDSIGKLTALEFLDLEDNRLATLPDTVGRLTALKRLELQGNRLSALPASLSAIPVLKDLLVEGNPFAPEVAAASASGHDGLMAFLKEIATDGVAVREAKLVVVGEGAVGKSTLLAAMLGEPFEEDRSSTHGIEVKALPLAEGTPEECVLNAWDFGGQPTYRPTHQLFFTAPAVYLVVWKPRHGPRQDNVEEWIELIRRRAGDDVSIHVVATHGGPRDRFAHIDEAALRQNHGQVIAGFHHIDSSTGDGIAALKAAIQATAARLPHFVRTLPASWRGFQDRQRRSPEPYLEYPEYLARAAEHGLTEASAKTLAVVATDLGHWCHYPNIPGLDQLVVLKGDWLSAAVSLVIDDPQTVRDHGLIEHSSLKEIWDDPGNPPHLRYPAKMHRILLRLMEEYEISYRVGGGGHGGRPPTSLIAQLVDPSTPPLEAWHDYGRDLPVQSRICKFSDASGNFHLPEGLVYRLIVRLHRFSLGRERYDQSLHWTGGLVIDHGLHGRALIRIDRNQLTVTVKAVAPEYLLTMIVEEIRAHVGEFWQGVKVHTLISCGMHCNDPDESGKGQWELERLFNRRLKGKHEITCGSCDEDVSIQLMLRGVSAPATDEDRFARAVEGALDAEFSRQVRRVNRDGKTFPDPSGTEATRIITQAESYLQDMLNALEGEAAFGPRLFTLEVVTQGISDSRYEDVSLCRISLWCEYSRRPNWDFEGNRSGVIYELRLPNTWLTKSEPWISAMAMTLRVVQPMGVAGKSPRRSELGIRQLSPPERNSRRSMEGMFQLGQAVSHPAGGENPGALLRELQGLIRDMDPTYGGLVRVRNRGKYLWVHPSFEAELNPGLPEMGDAQ